MRRLRKLVDAGFDVGAPVLFVVGVASLVTSVVLGFQIESVGHSIQATQKNQTTPAARSAEKKAGGAEKAASDAEGVVNRLPEIERNLKVALNNGQAQINTAVLWLDCEVYYGPRACGPPPPLPGVTPVTTTTVPAPSPTAPAPTHTVTPASIGAPAAPAPAPAPVPTRGHGGGRRHRG